MRKTFTLLFASALAFSCSEQVETKSINPNDYVDPFIGTDGIVHTFPGAAAPFGMIQLSPDGDVTGWNWCSGYHTSDNSIMGFSHNHLSGTGWSDLGDILIMPTVGTPTTEPGTKENPDAGYRSRISHSPENEKASPGYYMVNLLDYNIKAELTTTDRVGVHKYSFPATDSANIIIDPAHKIFGKVFDSQITITSDSTINGWCESTGWGGERTVYFSAVTSKPFASSKAGKKGYVTFAPTTQGEEIEIKVALSHVSQEGANANLATAKGQNFDTVHKQAAQEWQDALSRYEFESDDKAQLRILYTGLYHAFLQPNLNMDTDGKYVAGGTAGTDKLGGDVYTAEGFNNLSTFSFWDTFRAANQLLTLTNHPVLADISNTLIARHKTNGNLPLWELLGYDNTCMIGYPAAAILADAIMKDVKGFDYQEAYQAMRTAAFTPYISSSDGESGIKEYIELGYVPAPIYKSVSKTMEYAYYDWAIAQVAKKLGYTEDYDLFMKRSLGFLHHWNADKQLMWPKDAKGNWVDQNVKSWESLGKHYVSGNIYSYSYFYPHAQDTVVSLYGGVDKYVAVMDSMLNTPMQMEGEQHVDISGFIGHYAHGDEPGHQFLYLFSQAGHPEKIAPWIHAVSREFYNDTRNGMPNNDDCGQMSAWYIFSSMGFYPIAPGDNLYYIGAPMMKGAKIKTESGKTFTMTAQNYSPENIYVQSVTLNGKPLDRPYITHQEIMDGATLEFVMGNKEVAFLK